MHHNVDMAQYNSHIFVIIVCLESMKLREICGSHGVDHEEYYLLTSQCIRNLVDVSQEYTISILMLKIMLRSKHSRE
jgi:hypothetical protein